MLKSPARKPIATDKPARITGDAATKVSEMARVEPNDPRKSAPYAPLTASQDSVNHATDPNTSHRSGSVKTKTSAPATSAVNTASTGMTMACKKPLFVPATSARSADVGSTASVAADVSASVRSSSWMLTTRLPLALGSQRRDQRQGCYRPYTSPTRLHRFRRG